MAYAVKYLFKFQSSNGTVREIRVLKDGYSGSVIQRPLGRAPVIKKEKNGVVHGTSLTFYAECHIDREYIEFYTSDPKEYRVDVYAGSTLLWQGYITPELYSEPDIAPPYDVQVVATDGVGELKLYDFAPQGTVTLRALLTYLLGYTGLTTDVNLVSSLKPGSRGAGALLDMQICVDYLAGKTCYEALTYILTTLHATITRWGGAWVLVRETNVTFTSDKVRYFNTSGNSALLTGSVQTLGAMRSAPAWPVGQLSTVIDPAKNKVVVQAPWHPVSGLANSDMTSDSGWTKDKNARYNTDGYVLPTNVLTPVSETAVISQAVSLVGLRVALSISVKATGSTSEIAGQAYGALMGVFVTYKVGNVTYYLIKGEDGAPAWEQGDNIGTYVPPRTRVDYQQTLSVWDASRIEAEELKIDNIPPFLSGTSFPSGTLTVYILGSCVKVYGAHLDVVLPKGYQDILRIDNGARGEGDSVEIAIGRVTSEVAYYQSFLQGLLLDSGSIITAFSDANFTTAMDYLALISRDYALSAALPRALAKGTVYLESSIGMPPLVFAKGGLNYWLETWSWDLYEDELEIDARTLPSASLTVQSETILESDGSTVSSSSSGSSGGGSSISPGGSVTYFEPHNDGIILKVDYEYVSVPDVLLGEDEESLNALLAVIAGNAVQGAAAYGYFSSGVLPYNHGGTGLSSYTKGDLLYASANNTLAKLAANSTATKKFLTMTSSVPSWDGIAFGDLPTLYWANVAVSSSSSTTTEPTVKSITIGGATLTWVAPVGTTPGYLTINSALLTDGDQIVGGGTPGGGGGGGSKYLNDLLDVTITNPSNGQALVYQNGEWVNGSAIPDLSDYYTKTQTDAQISSAITALNLGAAATYGIGSVASGNTGLVTGGSVYSAINSALSSVLKFVGVTTTEITDGSTTNPVIINGSSYTAVTGNVVLYGAKEYLWTGSAWEEMGDEASWALKTIEITAGDGLEGGGNLTTNRIISLSDDTKASLALADSAYQKPAGGIPNSDLANSWVKVGTTQINLGSQQTSLAGLVNVTMSGKLTIGSAEIEWVAGTGGAPGYLKINSALLTDGDQIVGNGTPGGGGGGGASYLYELKDFQSGQSKATTTGTMLMYQATGITDVNGNTGAWKYASPSDVATAIGLSGYVTLAGAETITGAKTFTGGITSSGISISATNPTLIFRNSSGYFGRLYMSAANGSFYRVNSDWSAQYTMYDSGNLTKSVLTGLLDASGGYYLPLAGGTMTGGIKMSYTNNSGANFRFINNRAVSGGSGWADSVLSIYTAAESSLAGIGVYGSADALTYLYIGSNDYNGVNLRINSSSIKWGDNNILHAGNYASYTPILNSASTHATSSSVIYAPTSAGTAGQILISLGSGAPAWTTVARGASNKPIYINSSGVLTEGVGCLPLSAGSSYPLTGDLYLTAGEGIQATGGAGLLVYRPATDTWTGVSNTQWAVGAGDSQGVIRSNNNNLLHYRNGTTYDIWDKYNAGTSTTAWTCSTLTANGSVTIYESSSHTYRWNLNFNGAVGRLYAINDAGTAYNDILINNTITVTSGYKVGISNTSPSYKLHVNGTIASVCSGGGSIRIGEPGNSNSSAGEIFFQNGVLNGFKIAAVYAAYAARQNLVFYRSNVTADPYAWTPVEIFKLSYDGVATVTGTFVSTGDQVISSDERLKTHIEPVKLTVEQIAGMRAGTYDRKDSGLHSLGVIAQDWEKVLPESVSQGEYLTFKYAQTAMVSAIILAKHETEQDKEIKKLKARVRDLEKQLKMRS